MVANTTRPRQSGYAMIALIAIIATGMLYFIVNSLDRRAMEQKRALDTAKALALAKEALIGYAVTYRETHPNQTYGYFPCPADESGGSADGSASLSTATCGSRVPVVSESDGEAVIGLLPYRTLGLPDLRDEYGVCLWYAVSAAYNSKQRSGILNWDTHGQFKIVSSDGITVLENPNDSSHPNGGAAVVIFAAGPPLPSQTDRSGDTANKRCGGDGQGQFAKYLESTDFAASGHKTGLVTINLNQASTNDRVAWISPKEIFDRIRKRGDFSSQIDTLTTQIQTALATTSNPAPNPMDLLPLAGKQVGGIPTTPATSLVRNQIASAWQPYFDNWLNQFHYIKCNPMGSYCLDINGSLCDAALAFAGSSAASTPRITTTLDQYFENDGMTISDGKGAYQLMTSISPAGFKYTGQSMFNASRPSIDTVVCVGAPKL
jgi:hypothetical protein